jgi:apolipoprotein N-acyltransferase
VSPRQWGQQHWGQRLAEHLIRRACRRLPDGIREERYREWAGELPAILTDPDVRWQARRTVRALLFAADHARTVRRYPKPAQSQAAARGTGRLTAFFAGGVTEWVGISCTCFWAATASALFPWGMAAGLFGLFLLLLRAFVRVRRYRRPRRRLP